MRNKLTVLAVEKGLVIKGRQGLKRMDRNSSHPKQINEKLIMRIIRDNEGTEYGKLHHFSEIKTIEDYKKNVPYSDYDTYAPYIERMVGKNEKNLITSYKVIQYASTSGSMGVSKKIPVTDKSLKVYIGYSFPRAIALADEKYNHHLFIGGGLNLCEVSDTILPSGVPLGNISGTAFKKYRKLFPFYLTSPNCLLFPHGHSDMNYLKLRYALIDKDLNSILAVFMTSMVDMMNYLQNHWQTLVDDIEKGTFDPKIKIDPETKKKLEKHNRPNPKRAQELRIEFEKGFDTPIMPRIWPKLQMLCAIGTGGFASYTDLIRKYLGDVPIDFSVYAASEAIMAAARKIEEPRFNLLPDSCFYEFLPVDAGDDDTNTLGIEDLEAGKDYEIIITNQCGFYRYRINDVIRVLGFDQKCPQITFAYRKGELLNLVAEKMSEQHLRQAIDAFGKKLGKYFADYAVYCDTDVFPPTYQIFIEPEKDDDLDLTKLKEYGEMMKEFLGEANPYAKEYFEKGAIGTPIIHIQEPQTHALWREYKISTGASSAQCKPVRVLNSPQKEKFFKKLILDKPEEIEEKPE